MKIVGSNDFIVNLSEDIGSFNKYNKIIYNNIIDKEAPIKSKKVLYSRLNFNKKKFILFYQFYNKKVSNDFILSDIQKLLISNKNKKGIYCIKYHKNIFFYDVDIINNKLIRYQFDILIDSNKIEKFINSQNKVFYTNNKNIIKNYLKFYNKDYKKVKKKWLISFFSINSFIRNKFFYQIFILIASILLILTIYLNYNLFKTNSSYEAQIKENCKQLEILESNKLILKNFENKYYSGNNILFFGLEQIMKVFNNDNYIGSIHYHNKKINILVYSRNCINLVKKISDIDMVLSVDIVGNINVENEMQKALLKISLKNYE